MAHPNIALLKYWGKQDRPGNYPAAPSVSITLDGLTTTTRVTLAAEASSDAVLLNGEETEDPKIASALTNWRRTHDIPALIIESSNNFPTAAGLASSASGFAALATAVDALCVLRLPAGERSAMARIGSGSAARSIHGGFVALAPPAWHAKQLAPTEHWPLAVAVAVTDPGPKAISSSAGMERSRTTSPYYGAWVDNNARGYDSFVRAIAERDFATLAEASEASCLDMHALMLSSRPGLLYWQPATVACLHCVRSLRAEGIPVFFTVDAGPQVKAVCLPEALDEVSAALEEISGVHQVLRSGLGEGARLLDAS